MSGEPCFVIVFQDNNIIEAAHNNPGGFRPSTDIPRGEYVVVNCEIGHVGGNRVGITKVEARKVSVSITARFGDLCFLHERHPDNMTITPMSTTDLTSQQRKKTIDAIEKEYHWWWDNAPREVKSALQVAFSKEDEARELVRQGVGLASKQKYDEAKSLIEKGLSLYPEMGGARVDLGKISIELGHVSEAIRWFENELKLAKEPLDLSARSYLAAIYQAMGDNAKAEMHAQAAIETDSYRKIPSALAPEVVRKIRLAVQSSSKVGVDESNFDKVILQSKIPVLVEFWATWCGPCRMVAPIVDELANEYDGRISFVKLDVDQNPKTAARYSIMSIPTLLIFKKGKPVSHIVGFRPKEELRRSLEDVLE